jgi:hypothetical protein
MFKYLIIVKEGRKEVGGFFQNTQRYGNDSVVTFVGPKIYIFKRLYVYLVGKRLVYRRIHSEKVR